MKKNIIIITFLALASISQLSAQMTDRLIPHFGYFYTFINLGNLDNPAQVAAFNYNTFSLGSYYTIHQAKDIVSIGLDPNVNFGFNFTGTGSLSWYAQVPVFVMGRLGAGSTTYNTQKIGLGAGIGLMGTFWNSQPIVDKETFFNPTAVVEGTLNSRGSNVSGRIMFSLADAKRASDLFVANGTVFTNVLSLGIVYGF